MKSVGKYHLIDFGLSSVLQDNLAPGEIDPIQDKGKLLESECDAELDKGVRNIEWTVDDDWQMLCKMVLPVISQKD